MNRLSQFLAFVTTIAALSGCSTVTEMVESNLPEKHTGRPSIVVDLGEQEAYLYREGTEPRRPGFQWPRRTPHSDWPLSGHP